jgi:hypothetical protein
MRPKIKYLYLESYSNGQRLFKIIRQQTRQVLMLLAKVLILFTSHSPAGAGLAGNVGRHFQEQVLKIARIWRGSWPGKENN